MDTVCFPNLYAKKTSFNPFTIKSGKIHLTLQSNHIMYVYCSLVWHFYGLLVWYSFSNIMYWYGI